jgi:hypothetical protein
LYTFGCASRSDAFSSALPKKRNITDAPRVGWFGKYSMNTTLLLKLTAFAYLGIIAAGVTMPGVVGLRQHLATLPKFVRQLFWVYYMFIGLCLFSFGSGTYFLAGQLAADTPLARSVCGFLAIFWTKTCLYAKISIWNLKKLSFGWMGHPKRNIFSFYGIP